MSTPAKACISDMPTEILENILDFLHDDPAALYSASLVGRDWVSAPRYHMFHRTVIKEIDVPFRRTVMVQENVESFLGLSQSRFCTILPAIRCVILCAPIASLFEVVKVLARGATALSQVVVFFTLEQTSPRPSYSWMARMLPNIQDFTLETWSPSLDDDDWDLVTSFPHLRALAIHTIRDNIVTVPRDISGSSFHNIRNIQLRLLQSEVVFDWMNNFDSSPLNRVETLDLRIFRSSHKGWGSVKALSRFLRRNSQTMKHLRLAIDYQPIPKDLSNDDLDLRPLINLRSLFLQTHDMYSVCSTISSLRSPLVESLTVYCVFPWAPDAPCFSYERECACDPYRLFTQLADIMERMQSIFGTTILQLSDFQKRGMGDVSIRWTQRGVLKFIWDDYYEGDTQRNTFSALRHLLAENPLNKSTQPLFLR